MEGQEVRIEDDKVSFLLGHLHLPDKVAILAKLESKNTGYGVPVNSLIHLPDVDNPQKPFPLVPVDPILRPIPAYDLSTRETAFWLQTKIFYD